MKLWLRKIMLLTILMVVLASCVHEPLCYTHPHKARITIEFDWRDAPDVQPASMSVYLFPHNDVGHSLRYEFAGCEGGSIEVPEGAYDLVCVNSDTREVLYSERQTRDHFYLTTPDTGLLASLAAMGIRAATPPRAPGTEKQRVVQPVEPLFRHRVDSIACVKDAPEQVIRMYPAPATCEYTVVIDSVPNLKYTAGVSASITSLADGMHFYRGHTSTVLATVPFLLQTPRSAGERLSGGFLTFGDVPGDHTKHILSVFVVLANGEKWYHEVDVTDQVHNAPDPRHVYIYVKGVPIPKPIVNGGGFHPQVDGWQSEIFTIPM